MSEWIKCSDRLPEDSTPKLCKVQLNDERKTVVHFECTYWRNGDYDWSDWCGDNCRDDGWTVIAWMEIPE